MFEVLAIVVGVGLGAALRHRPPGPAIMLIVPLGIVLGAGISALAGELELSAAFLLFDTLQVTVSAVLTYVLANALTRAQAR